MISAESWADYDAQKEEAERRWLRTRPVCNLCGEPITDDFCFVVTDYPEHSERMLSCVHTGCVRQYVRRRKNVFLDMVEEILENYFDRTPCDQNEKEEY